MLFVMANLLENAFGGRYQGNELPSGSTTPHRRTTTSAELVQVVDRILDHAIGISGVPEEWLTAALQIAFPVTGNRLNIQTTRTLTHTFGLRALGLEIAWGTTSPLTMVATTLFLEQAIAQKHAALTAAIDNLPNRKFGEEWQREKVKEREEGDRQLLGSHLPQLTASIQQYAQQYWGEKGPLMLQALRVLITKTNTDFAVRRPDTTGINRERILLSLQEERVEEANNMLDTLFGIRNEGS